MTFYMLALLGLYVLLPVYSLFGGWWRLQRQPVRRISFILVPTAVFAALWWVGCFIWTMLLWLYVYGDEGGDYQYAGIITSVVIAISVSAIVFVRMLAGYAKHVYLRNCLVCSVLSALWFAGFQAHEFTSQILGWSAHGAAENYALQSNPSDDPIGIPSSELRVVEEEIPRQEQIPSSVRRFIAYRGTQRLQTIHVAPYGWWWWKLSASRSFSYSDVFDWSDEYAKSHREEAIPELKKLIEDYPDHPSLQKAQQKLQQLQSYGEKQSN